MTDTPKKSFKHWWYIGLAGILVLAAIYYIGSRAGRIEEPWVWHRGDNEPAKNLGISVSAGYTTSTINTSSASSTSHSGFSCIDISSIAVRTRGDHPFSIACAAKIAEQLKTIPAIQRIEFAAHGPLIGKDTPIPPWVVQVDVGDLNERTIPNRSLSGNIYVSFGVAAARQLTMYGDDGVAPLVQFEHSATNVVNFTHTGISSQSVFYEKIAEAVAKKAVETMAAEFDKLSRTLPPLPRLPEAFYPAYHEASAVPPIPGLVSTTTLVDGRRLMLPHYSLVQLNTNFAGTDEEFVNEIQQAMNEAGWKGFVGKHEIFKAMREDGEILKRHDHYDLRLDRDNETFYLFQEMRSDIFDSLNFEVQTMLTGKASQSPPSPESRVFLLERMEKMNRDSVFSAIQTLLDENAPTSALLPFAHRVRIANNETAQHLQEQIRIRLLDVRTSTPSEQLAVAQFFEQVGDMETAKEMLFKAWQIRQLTPFPKGDSEYMALAKKLEVEEEMQALPPPTIELFEEYGFILLAPENCPMEVEIEWDKEARFAAVNEDGLLSLLQFTVRYDNGTFHTDRYQTTFMKHGFGQSSAKSSGSHFESSFRVGDREGTFYFSLMSEPPRGSEGSLRVRVEFR